MGGSKLEVELPLPLEPPVDSPALTLPPVPLLDAPVAPVPLEASWPPLLGPAEFVEAPPLVEELARSVVEEEPCSV